MTEKNITVQVDLANRELPYLKILKNILQNQHGIETRVLPQDPIWSKGRSSFFGTASKLTDVLVTPSYNANRTLNTLAWKQLSGAILVHWHSEQLIDERFYSEKLNTGCTEKYLSDVEYHLVWGEDFARLLNTIGKVPKERIYIVGNPKMDLIDLHRKPRQIQNRRKAVLFVCDFLWATMDECEYWKTLERYGYRHEDDFRGFIGDAYEKYCAVAEKFIIANPEVQVFIRPHPGEPDGAYEHLLKYDNARLDTGTPFIDSAKNSDLIVQFLSTSYFESIHLGKPVICLDLVADWGSHYRDYFKYYNFVQSDNFQYIAQQYLSRPETFNPNKDGMEQLFSIAHGPSIERTAIALKDIIDKRGRRKRQKWIASSRAVSYIVSHSTKNIAGMLSYFLFKLGVRNKLTRRVINAEKAWLTGEGYFDSVEIGGQEYNDGRPSSARCFQVVSVPAGNIVSIL